jgi:murein DD-endopeptidase MepM/ murein hydrolase activator NlpD
MATSSLRRRSGRADALARWLLAALLAGALLLLAAWAWRQPFMARPRALWELSRMPPPTSLPVPVQGVAPRQIAATFGAPRGSDRRHEGLDIFAARGTPVRSTTRGIVIAIRDRGLGGRQVWVLGPAGERHYYAHLDDWALALAEGEVVEAGTPLGTVGNTGNARTTPPHLHYGIYGGDGALDPLPRIRAGR